MEAYTITIGPPYNIIVLIQRLLFQYNDTDDTGEIVVDILSLSAIALSLSLW